jgi:hypothetical protein
VDHVRNAFRRVHNLPVHTTYPNPSGNRLQTN